MSHVPRNRARPARLGRRLAAWILVSCLLLGNLGPALHLALVRHATCPEHGELVHAEELAAHAGSTPANPAPSRPIPSLEAGPAQADQHEHCAQGVPIRQGSLGLHAAPTAARAQAERARGPAPAAERRLPSVSQLLLAPKHSPPLAS